MNPTTQLIEELKTELPTSYSVQRKAWAKRIVNEQVDMKEIAKLFTYEKRVATRLSWLISDIGNESADYLRGYLPYLFQLSKQELLIDLKPQLVKYWYICGIPDEDEGEAVDFLFQVLQSHEYKLHFKHSAIKCLLRLIKNYPELKEELKILIEYQLETDTTANFKRWCNKILNQKKLWD